MSAAVTPAEKAAILAHLTAQVAQVKQRSGEPVQWKSATFDGAIVDGWIDSDGEPEELHAHFGCVGGQVWLESVKVGGVELIDHLTDATVAVLVHEALRSLRGGK